MLSNPISFLQIFRSSAALYNDKITAHNVFNYRNPANIRSPKALYKDKIASQKVFRCRAPIIFIASDHQRDFKVQSTEIMVCKVNICRSLCISVLPPDAGNTVKAMRYE